MLLKFVIRNIQKRQFLNLIKVLGLTLGLSGILFISLFINNELSYDKFHSKADRIYRLTLTDSRFLNESHFARIPNSEHIPNLADNFPEIQHFVRLSPIRGGVLFYSEKYYTIDQAFVCDSTFFEVFDAKLLMGDKRNVLNAPASMVVSESFAKKVFGNGNPVGEVISIPSGQYYGEKIDFTIKGVMKDFPQCSHFHPELITTSAKDPINGWAYVYLLLHETLLRRNLLPHIPNICPKQPINPLKKSRPKPICKSLLIST
jgi:putative ABC transport system permease protein